MLCVAVCFYDLLKKSQVMKDSKKQGHSYYQLCLGYCIFPELHDLLTLSRQAVP